MTAITVPGEGDVILCLTADEGRELRGLYPQATVCTSDSRSLDGMRVTGRIFSTDDRPGRLHHQQALMTLSRAARASGGDPAIHKIGEKAVYVGDV